jgi:tRNA(fMet)-specific endonuclease VapC
MVILDTDHVSLLERADQPIGAQLHARLLPLLPEDYATTIISYEEQCRGWLRVLAEARSVSDQVDAYRRLLRQLNGYCKINVLPFDELAAIEFQRLKKAKIRIGTMDLKNAAIALSIDATLLTRNLRDFIKVPGLKIEDWTKE